jgi:hypothetical protein
VGGDEHTHFSYPEFFLQGNSSIKPEQFDDDKQPNNGKKDPVPNQKALIQRDHFTEDAGKTSEYHRQMKKQKVFSHKNLTTGYQ